MNTRAISRLLRQVRPWIEPAQSYDKNQLALSEVFLNSLPLAESLSLLADMTLLRRAQALLVMPKPELPMFG